MNRPEGAPLTLLDSDIEGGIIQQQGVQALVYSEKLWWDKSALLAMMREDNANAEVAKAETELDAFGLVSQVVVGLVATSQQSSGSGGYEPTTLSVDQVMAKIGEVGFGTIPQEHWQHMPHEIALGVIAAAPVLHDE